MPPKKGILKNTQDKNIQDKHIINVKDTINVKDITNIKNTSEVHIIPNTTAKTKSTTTKTKLTTTKEKLTTAKLTSTKTTTAKSTSTKTTKVISPNKGDTKETEDSDDDIESSNDSSSESSEITTKDKSTNVKDGKGTTPDEIDVDDAEDDIEEELEEEIIEQGTKFTYKEPIRGEYEIIVISNENRITSDMMSKEELTEAISERIKQLEKESISFVDISDLSDPASIAKREISQKKCPLILRRSIGNILNMETGKQTMYYEYWDVNEMKHYCTY